MAVEGEGHLWRPGKRAAGTTASDPATASAEAVGEAAEAQRPEGAKAEARKGVCLVLKLGQ